MSRGFVLGEMVLDKIDSCITVKGPRHLGMKAGWFRSKKISKKLKYVNLKCELRERYFLSDSIGLATLRMSHVTATGERCE